MTPREFDALCERREKLIERQFDLPAAFLWSLIAEVNRNREKRAEPFTVQDFPLFREQWASEQFPEEDDSPRQLNRMLGWIESMGGVNKLDPKQKFTVVAARKAA